MITEDEIDAYIQRIPPASATLKETLLHINAGELSKAAKAAQNDPALKSYLKNIVNKPIYGFQKEIDDISQIFGILGVSLSQQTLYNYMITLLSPKKWVLFKLNAKLFSDLQANLSKKWEKILHHLEIKDKEIYTAIALLPASIIVTEALFAKRADDVHLLRRIKALDYNTILMRLCDMTLFDICEAIARKWEMNETIITLIHAASGKDPSEDDTLNTLGKWMHLLLFYELSNPQYIHADLNDFIDFEVAYVDDIYDDFAALMEVT